MLKAKHEQFIKEKQYLLNVSPATIEWYEQSLRWLNVETPTQDQLKGVVYAMRDAGLKPSSVNCRARAINSYLKWAGLPLTIPRLKEERRTLPTFATTDITKFSAWKPQTFAEHRLQCLTLFLADVGCRISEALGLRWADVDFDNLLVTLHGKGAKDRVVPFSFDMRRYLWKWKAQNRWDLVFASRSGTEIGRRDVLRDVKELCTQLGIVIPERTLHAFRHSFALHYLRNGGSVFHLQKTLGHSSLEMSRRYSNLQTEDLQKVHQQCSLLSSTISGRRQA